MDSHTAHHHHHDAPTIALPRTAAEADAFVAAVMAEPDAHAHSTNAAMAREHAALLRLVARGDATHVAIGNGSWFDASNWWEGRIPDAGAKVLIPRGVTLDYDGVSDTRLFTVRVDGRLDFATDTDSRMVVDTLVVAPNATMTIGTADNPVDASVTAEIIIANNGAINVAWDPMLLSRGLVSHGDIQIHGATKDSHEKVVTDPMRGHTFVEFAEIPTGWQVGDTIVIAGTRYEGRKWDGWANAWFPPEDEVRVISRIEGNRVHFDAPLVHNHDTPRADLKTSVANYSRNVRIATENGAEAAVHERGHVMFMHSDSVDVRYAEFFELGRTNKQRTSLNVGDFETIEATSNVRGRYSFHFHRTGTEDLDNPAMAVGNAVFGSPGWGFVHHDSNAILQNNASYRTFGAGFVAESGNETGAWIDNIAIFARGISWGAPKVQTDLSTFDIARGGDGFWFQGRMVASTDNIAASVNHGFVYFHRGGLADNQILTFDASSFDIPEALHFRPVVRPDDVPILGFSGNEVFAAKEGLHVVKSNPNQGHDIHSVFQDFTAWSVRSGAHFEYTAHYIIKNFDLIGKTPTPFSDTISGISFGSNTGNMTVVDANIEGFRVGINLSKHLVGFSGEHRHTYTVVDATFTNVRTRFGNFDPTLDTIVSRADLPAFEPDLRLTGPLTYREGTGTTDRIVRFRGSKIDSLGEGRFPGAFDGYSMRLADVVRHLERDGYFTTSDGQRYFLVEVFFSDRLNGDIYVETHAVFIDPNVPLGNRWHAYRNAVNNGVQDLHGEGAPVLDQARLFARLEGSEWVFFRDGAAVEEPEPAPVDDGHHHHHDHGGSATDGTAPTSCGKPEGECSCGTTEGSGGTTDGSGGDATVPPGDGATSCGKPDGECTCGTTDTTGGAVSGGTDQQDGTQDSTVPPEGPAEDDGHHQPDEPHDDTAPEEAPQEEEPVVEDPEPEDDHHRPDAPDDDTAPEAPPAEEPVEEEPAPVPPVVEEPVVEEPAGQEPDIRDDHGHHDEVPPALPPTLPPVEEPVSTVIAGRVMDRAGLGLGGARVLFVPDDGAQMQTTADTLGSFSLDPGAQASGRLEVSRAFGAGDPALTSQSATEVLRLAVGLPPTWGAATAHDFIAADFDGNGRVTSGDAQQLLRAASGLRTPHSARWVFVDADADLSHVNARNVTFENGARINDLGSGGGEMNMVGILVGQLQEF